MFKSRILPTATLCLGLALILSSFNWSGKTPQIEPKVTDVKSESEPVPPPPIAQAPIVATEKRRSFARGLRVGDRFPFVKTVVQRVTQQQAEDEVTTTSRFTIAFFLEVNDVISSQATGSMPPNRNSGDILLTVRYTRVQFERDLPQQVIDYDSDNPPHPLPPQAQPYHALVGNGFSFWLDRDFQINELVQFPDFIQSCLHAATPQQRAQVWKSFANTSSKDHIANFIDDSIGLLPPTAVKPNDRWHRVHRVEQPVPLELAVQYTLGEITDETALVFIGGAVKPSPPAGTNDIKVEIHGGSLRGQCTTDRRTGMPIHARVEQTIEMEVHLAGQESFQQTKQTLTRIEAVKENSSVRMPVQAAAAEQATQKQ